ncbi:hypothetical protein AX774_g5490 [Zancudomyces culisetae]|uniref:Uncharacterized protein n=1 Tax=Zancudomyces culisetae TaxID=1213189 RepID=A0A1R1PJA5_ZANCU|nr:hypothetical protein AX774_g5490 [Zancudomyces culisetae]|eukprot:OMH81060.1 hypothetical protein AX774_g5490 [Zancudomyces culisetae]
MIKSVILSTLVASSVFAFNGQNAQNAQNRTLQAIGKNSVSESNFNEMHYGHSCRCSQMTVELFRTGSGQIDPLAVGKAVSNPQGTFNIRRNKCYSAPQFAAVKMRGSNISKGAFMVCTQSDCTGLCYTYPMSQGSSINELWNIFGSRWAVSYAWLSPFV